MAELSEFENGMWPNIWRKVLVVELRRIADAQEALLRLALDSRQERKDMADKMKEAFKRPPMEER